MLKWIQDYIDNLKQYFIKEDAVVLGLFLFGSWIIRKNSEIRYPTATLGTFLGYLSKNLITNVIYLF